MRKKDDEKQNAIKRAVVKIVLEEGMHGASISKIAKAAGVSPATVYIYYDNKDVMLRDIYYEYAEGLFSYLLNQVTDSDDAKSFVDIIVREYYNYMIDHEEVYHFVEQFGSCPSLNQGCMALKGPELLNKRIYTFKETGLFNNYDNSNIWAMLLYPVKGIASKTCDMATSKDERLNELIDMIQQTLIKD